MVKISFHSAQTSVSAYDDDDGDFKFYIVKCYHYSWEISTLFSLHIQLKWDVLLKPRQH